MVPTHATLFMLFLYTSGLRLLYCSRCPCNLFTPKCVRDQLRRYYWADFLLFWLVLCSIPISTASNKAIRLPSYNFTCNSFMRTFSFSQTSQTAHIAYLGTKHRYYAFRAVYTPRTLLVWKRNAML